MALVSVDGIWSSLFSAAAYSDFKTGYNVKYGALEGWFCC